MKMRISGDTFNIIIFLGRPAAGKSEVIDYIKKTEKSELKKNLFISDYETLDDFVDLWEKGEEDDILEDLGRQRLYTKKDPTGYSVADKFLYKFLIKKINASFHKKYLNRKDFFDNHTLFIEFSRGGIDAYKTAFSLLSKEILKRAVVFYTQVSFDESCRKNRRRYNPDAKDSILQHALPDYVMEVYRVDDWDNLTYSKSDYFEAGNIKIPYYTFLNEPELTDDFKKLAPAVKSGMDKLKITAENF
ncbi:MAG TPA: hypothetical protein PKY81_17065 [bacterium]|nr:hypothetical protein [bacterium]